MSLNQPKEFHDRRIKGIGGSEVASILGISPWKTAFSLWQEKTKRIVPEDISHLPFVARGILGERACRMLLERQMLKTFIPKQWQGEKPWHLCSDDGWDLHDNVILEIKCLGKEAHERVKNGMIPDYYQCQIFWNLYVSKANKCIFISFRPEDETMHIVEVLPNPHEQEKLVAAVDNFWLNHVLKDKPPELQDGDYMELDNPVLSQLVEEYKTLHGQVKTLEAKLEELTLQLKPYTATQRAVKCNGVKLLRSERQGTIDYKKFLADSHIPNNEIEKYRKKPTESFRVFVPALDLTKI